CVRFGSGIMAPTRDRIAYTGLSAEEEMLDAKGEKIQLQVNTITWKPIKSRSLATDKFDLNKAIDKNQGVVRISVQTHRDSQESANDDGKSTYFGINIRPSGLIIMSGLRSRDAQIQEVSYKDQPPATIEGILSLAQEGLMAVSAPTKVEVGQYTQKS